MNRRQLLTSTGAVASLGLCAGIVAGAPGCTPSPAAEPDPIWFALHAHTVAYAAWQASDSDADPVHVRLDKLEQATWDRVCQTPPTTLEGLARMASYVQRHLTRDTCASDASIHTAWLSIATAAATLQAKEQVRA